MKKILLTLLFAYSIIAAYAQFTTDKAIQLKITTQKSPTYIKLSWPAVSNATTTYSVFRKNPDSTNWGTALATIPRTSTLEYQDNNVILSQKYEYKVVGNDGTTPFGYALSGIEVPYKEKGGRVILLVDSTMAIPLAAELQTLKEDLIGEGWRVTRHDISTTRTPTNVKMLIKNDYTTFGNVKAVFIIGHIAVPYSGELYPDGHTEHNGAWPADIYYGDMLGTWTDASVNNTTASRPENKNIPGDGKFDQSKMADIAIQVGRVDMSNLPSFALNETNLLRQYFNKDHDFRRKNFSVRRRAFINDGFGYFGGEAFAACGWRNFATLVSSDSVVSAGNYFDMIGNNSFIWAYGCGAGSYQSANGIGSTSDYATKPLNTVFVSNFGSYFGDWDNSNNFLRAALANSGKILVNFWNGRPYWALHSMGMGSTIGESMLITQKDEDFQYVLSYGYRQVHVALMGDPTLAMYPLAPATNATVIKNTNSNIVNWTASVDTAIIGYQIYRAPSLDSVFIKLTTTPITVISFTDMNPLSDSNNYLIRAVRLENTPSGSFYNYSNGTLVRGSGIALPLNLLSFNAKKINEQVVQLDWSTANESNTDKFDIEKSTDGINFKNIGSLKAKENSTSKTNYSFRDNNIPLSTHDILYYRLKQINLNGTYSYSTIKALLWKNSKYNFVKVFPNPSDGVYKLLLGGDDNVTTTSTTEITVNDITGKQVYHFADKLPMNSIFDLDIRSKAASKGVYMLHVKIGKYQMSEKLITL